MGFEDQFRNFSGILFEIYWVKNSGFWLRALMKCVH
jgi:hypothetical protein